MIDRGKSEERFPSSRDQGHLEVCLDCAYMETTTEDRESSISMDRFLEDRWLVARSMKCEGTQYRWITGKLVNEVITSDVQALVVKFDQEVSTIEVKSSLMGELHSVGGTKLFTVPRLTRWCNFGVDCVDHAWDSAAKRWSSVLSW